MTPVGEYRKTPAFGLGISLGPAPGNSLNLMLVFSCTSLLSSKYRHRTELDKKLLDRTVMDRTVLERTVMGRTVLDGTVLDRAELEEKNTTKQNSTVLSNTPSVSRNMAQPAGARSSGG